MHKTLCDEQYPQCTTGQVGVLLVDKILLNMKKNNYAGTVFLDQYKAFEKVNQHLMKHNPLTHELYIMQP